MKSMMYALYIVLEDGTEQFAEMRSQLKNILEIQREYAVKTKIYVKVKGVKEQIELR